MRLICFGDSNTYGYDPRFPLGERYSDDVRWTNLLAKATGWDVVNVGLNGRRIPHSPAEVTAIQNRLTPDVDCLVVMLGGNDISHGLEIEEVSARMEAFIRQLPCARILLVAPPPAQPGTWVSAEELLRRRGSMAVIYRDLAEKLGIGFANAGEWGVELSFDGVHFTPDGHQAFARGIQQALETFLA